MARAAVTVSPFLLAVILCGGVAAAAPPTPAGDPPPSLVDAVREARDRVFPTLVHVEPVSDVSRGGKKIEARSTGSGAIISPDGLVVTNFHVAGTAKRMTCTLSDRRRCGATRIGADAATDLALLRLDLAELGATAVPHATFGASADVQVGDVVLAMGSPLGLTRSLSFGVVSCADRYLDGLRLDGHLPTGLFNTWIQTDAAINPGNSGGPLVDLRGRIVGVNARGYRNADNVGFAIPVDVVRDVVARLESGGRVTRSRVGVTLQPRPYAPGQPADDPASPRARRGALVASVDPGSPADRGGLRAGDVLVAYAGIAIDAAFDEDMPPLLRALADVAPGSEIEIELLRGGEPRLFRVVPEEWEAPSAEDVELDAWGLTVRDLTDAERRDRWLEPGRGVLVTGVRVGSAAGLTQPRLAAGDVLLEAGGAGVKDALELEAALEALRSAGAPASIALLRVRRGEALLRVALRVSAAGLPEAAGIGSDADAGAAGGADGGDQPQPPDGSDDSRAPEDGR